MPSPIHIPRLLAARPVRAAAVAAITSCAVLAAAIAPARSAASVVSAWTPASAGLVQTERPCPSPATAAAYNATCWTVSLDQTNPLYSPSAPYPWGQCTYWAVEMRPDIWNNQSASDPDPSNWTAYTWAAHAQLEGLAVDHTPSQGSIMVWPQTVSDQTGHVAYVQSAGYDQSTGETLITVEEMNDTTFDDPSQGQGDTLTLRESSSQLSGLQFVHPAGYTAAPLPVAGAGTTPGSTGSAPTSTSTAGSASKSGSTSASTGTASASASSASRAPGLTLRIGGRTLQVSSSSAAPLRTTVRRLPSGRVIRHRRLRPGASMRLPGGRVRVCVAQAAAGDWRSARACVTVARGPREHVRRVHHARAFAQATTIALLER